MALLTVNNLCTTFSTPEGVVRAVDGVSFSLERGEALGVVGESGSGKSVTVMSLMRLIATPPGRIESGEAIFEGRDLLKLPEANLRSIRGDEIAMIFQDPLTSLNPFLTVKRQLTEVLETHRRMSPKKALTESIHMLELVGIPSPAKRINDYPHEFSGGMRQRVMIAMALLCRPKLLIADEPTTALDVTIQAQILELIADLRHEFGTTVILITHNLGIVAEVCDHVAVMYAGKIAEYGKMGEIFVRPRHPYTQGLLRSLPRLDEKRAARLESIVGQPPDLTLLPTGCAFHPRCEVKSEHCLREFPSAVRFGDHHYAHCWHAEDRS
ncbi:MAG: ABC transporter ATP-binding protein [Deltaproteobacteria bacterium]|nr:ABC transporter ATP-binding protein [Deltaproteobacteria bacterium]